ncbi:30S ribosomal protein S1 [Membranihabitans maritimus]|uniref:30S ribosomal protein S1 n=1 Tax=Membranihabitans maritimus TaxID=2904244 RepID=UPI001F0154DA|nr:30S ribosomal protein S1 [Membranihabitans maritimus]
MSEENKLSEEEKVETSENQEQPETKKEEAAPVAEAPAETEEKTEDSTENAETAEQVDETPVAHDDFDWTIKKSQTHSYGADEFDQLLQEYDSTFTDINENEVVKGVVTNVRDGDVILDINYKSNGVVALSEFREYDELKEGDSVDVYVERKEDENGQLQLSRRKARLLKTWDALKDSYHNDTIIKGSVISKTKGGLIVDVNGLETFLPGSQIDIKPIIDYDSYVGKSMEFKVVKINEAIKNAVVSHKALIESDLAEQRDQIIQSLEKGQVLEGVVKNITDFGAFMDLGGIDGLLYITDISWGRINHPSEVLELNQKINVVVLDFDDNKKRISLGLKQLQPHPWDVLDQEIKEGSKVGGTIVNIEDYGAFLEITPGVEGLIHVSEVSWSNQPVNAREFFKLGQDFEAIVVTIDREERKMSLSLKQLSEDPWDKIEEKFPIGSRHSGEVKNLTPYGVFVELDEGIGGMVHISDLSWTKRFSHPSEYTKVGNDLEIVILEIDKEDRKLTLGHKQIEENPWDTFEKVFPVGSYHEATIVKVDDRGAIVQLPYGLEAFAPIKHIRKEDGTMGQVDESMTFKVLEFNRDDKRILVSHLRYLEDIQKEADQKVRNEKRQQRVETRKTIQKQQGKIERTTLGDLSDLAALRNQLTGDDSGASASGSEEE